LRLKPPYFFLFFLLVHCCVQAQINKPIPKVSAVVVTAAQIKSDSNFTYSHLIPGSFSLMNIDVLGNMYVITNTNQLKKIKPNGDSIAVFNDVKKYGILTSIDVSNPLKVLLYYKNYSTVVILDRLLGFRTSLNVKKEKNFKVKAIATAYDGNIWLFDEQDFKLKKINEAGKILMESIDWRQLFDETPTPTEIHDENGYVYLYDIKKGFYIFDYYGALKNNLPFLNWQHVAVLPNKITGFVGNTLHTYEPSSLNIKKYTLSSLFKNNKDIKAKNGKVYLLNKEGIEIYTTK
jgi:hypothetical protein